MNTDRKAQLEAALAHLDARSNEELRKAGRALKAGQKNVKVRIVYTPSESKRVKEVVMPHVGANEVVGTLVNARWSKQGKLVLLVADEARRELGRQGPVWTNLSAERITNVVYLEQQV